ncbi:MAG: hypothetical protein IPM63_09950 [Acidobacteriota bacterium]|nr:MAG: hypothetical protein IPM63_09950 [Acidobacteriota bacterium]
MRKASIIFAALALAAAFAASGCRGRTVSPSEVVAVPEQEITLDPLDDAWYPLPYHPAKLILQDLVEPRLMEPSTAEVEVTAMTDGKDVAFRLEWIDGSQNDLPGPQAFIDGCAIQLPSKQDANVPAPQMGEEGKSVEIAYWRADWQAIVDGRADEISSIYPNAAVDHYPFKAESLQKDPKKQQEMARRYAPARALGNDRSGPRKQPVEDMVAGGPGTLSPASPVSSGKGVRTDKGWSVVIVRPLPAFLTDKQSANIAFAIWQGENNETGARKMRTGWIPLVIRRLPE